MGLFDFLFPKKFKSQKLPTQLQQLLGFSNGELKWYERALTHKSVLPKDDRDVPGKSNERLEFLGDAVLDSIVGDFLFNAFPNNDEGFLTKTRSRIVSRKNLSDVAVKIGIDKLVYTNLGKHDRTETIYGNAFEAIIGAIYIDKGYLQTAQFIKRTLLNDEQIAELVQSNWDFKSKLIEWGQREKKEIRFNTTRSKSGEFSTQLFLNQKLIGKGSGGNKKEAEQAAAESAFHLTKTQH